MIKPDSTVIKQFAFEGKYIDLKVNKTGLINNTYILRFRKDDGTTIHYALQRINKKVFTRPAELMENIVGVTAHLRKKICESGGNPDRETLTFIPARSGKYYFEDRDGDFWRTYTYVEQVVAHNRIEKPIQFKNAGIGFGRFQNYLADYPSKELFETIPRFHDTEKRYNDLMNSIEKDLMGRVKDVQKEIEFIKNHHSYCSIILNGINDGSIPVRVTHNDTKLNNVLMDIDTDEAVCVIDLDTIMPGSALYDFGDAIRFGASSADEDEPDVNLVHFKPDLFEEFAEGFLSQVANKLTPQEINNLATSAIIMTLECGMRFLADYLDGDVYFHISREGQNLDRTRTQLKLVEEMVDMLPELNSTVRKIADKYITQ